MKLKSIYFLFAFSALILSACDPENVLKPAEETIKPLYEWDETKIQTITFQNSTVSTTSSKVVITGTTATITDGGYYTVSGNSDNGRLIVDAKDEIVKIRLA